MFNNHKEHEDFHKVHKGTSVFFVHSWCSLRLNLPRPASPFRRCLKSQNLLNARGAKGLHKERKVLILKHLFFATFAKNLCVFALKLLLRHSQFSHSTRGGQHKTYKLIK